MGEAASIISAGAPQPSCDAETSEIGYRSEISAVLDAVVDVHDLRLLIRFGGLWAGQWEYRC